MFKPVSGQANFTRMEESTLKFWEENGVFEKSMKNRDEAARIDAEATRLLQEGTAACDAVYAAVTAELRG